MADSDVVRQQRSRAHRSGDHSLCLSECPRQPDAVLTATRAELTAAGRLNTYLGATALVLAERIDQSTGGTGLASLARQLRQTMSAALAGVKVTADPLDQLRAPRSRSGQRRVADHPRGFDPIDGCTSTENPL
jgi:hypothetical protein